MYLFNIAVLRPLIAGQEALGSRVAETHEELCGLLQGLPRRDRRETQTKKRKGGKGSKGLRV